MNQQSTAVILGSVFVAGYELTLEILQKEHGISRQQAICEVNKLTSTVSVVSLPAAFMTACQFACIKDTRLFRADLDFVFRPEDAETIFSSTRERILPYCTDDKAITAYFQELKRRYAEDLTAAKYDWDDVWINVKPAVDQSNLRIMGTNSWLDTCPVCKTERRCDAKTKWFRCKCGEQSYPFKKPAS